MTYNSLNAGYFVAALVFNRLIYVNESLGTAPELRPRGHLGYQSAW